MTKNDLQCILLVDEDQTSNFKNGNLIQLVEGDLEIQTALNGKRALDFVLEHKDDRYPMLILLDLSMPEMGGFKFLDELSKLAEDCRENIVIVLLTSSDYEKDRERASHYPVVTAYVTKPFTQEKMVSIIETCFMR